MSVLYIFSLSSLLLMKIAWGKNCSICRHYVAYRFLQFCAKDPNGHAHTQTFFFINNYQCRQCRFNTAKLNSLKYRQHTVLSVNGSTISVTTTRYLHQSPDTVEPFP